MRLIIICMLAFGFQIVNPVMEKLKYYEGKQKQITLKFHKIPKSQRNTEDLKLGRKTYYKIIHPKYKTESVTHRLFDETKWTKEMGYYFQLATEQVMVKKPCFKWVLNPEEMDGSLKYESVYSEFITTNKVVIKTSHIGYSNAPSIIQDSISQITKRAVDEERNQHRLEVHEKMKDCYFDLQQDISVCYANGTIEEISKDEYDSEDANHFTLKKGNWKIEEVK